MRPLPGQVLYRRVSSLLCCRYLVNVNLSPFVVADSCYWPNGDLAPDN